VLLQWRAVPFILLFVYSNYERLFIMSEGRPVLYLQGSFTLMWENFIISVFKIMNQWPIVSAISVDMGPYCYPRGKL